MPSDPPFLRFSARVQDGGALNGDSVDVVQMFMAPLVNY